MCCQPVENVGRNRCATNYARDQNQRRNGQRVERYDEHTVEQRAHLAAFATLDEERYGHRDHREYARCEQCSQRPSGSSQQSAPQRAVVLLLLDGCNGLVGCRLFGGWNDLLGSSRVICNLLSSSLFGRAYTLCCSNLNRQILACGRQTALIVAGAIIDIDSQRFRLSIGLHFLGENDRTLPRADLGLIDIVEGAVRSLACGDFAHLLGAINGDLGSRDKEVLGVGTEVVDVPTLFDCSRQAHLIGCVVSLDGRCRPLDGRRCGLCHCYHTTEQGQ